MNYFVNFAMMSKQTEPCNLTPVHVISHARCLSLHKTVLHICSKTSTPKGGMTWWEGSLILDDFVSSLESCVWVYIREDMCIGVLLLLLLLLF